MTDLIVLVRYPGYVRRAVIRQSRYRPETRKRTKSGRPYAEVWHIVRWIDERDETNPQAPPVPRVADALRPLQIRTRPEISHALPSLPQGNDAGD